MASKIQFSKLSPVQQQVLLNFQVDPTTFYSKGNSAWRDYVGANSSFRKDLWDRLDDSQREAISRYNPKALNDSEMQSVINSSIRRATERVAPYVAAAVSMPAAPQVYSALAKSGELAYAPISRLLSTPVGQALSKTAQVGFAIDAAERLADREGIAKTANKIKDGDVVGAIKSGTGDLLDITIVTPGLNAARPVIKSIPNIFAPLNKKLIIYNNKKFVDRINNAFPQYEKIELSNIDLANTDKVNKIVKKRILQDNTFVRGVRDAIIDDDILATNRILKERYGILKPTAEDRMKFYAIHYAPETGAGRAGLDFPYDGALYTSNSINTAKGYAQEQHYGEKTGGIAIVRRPVYFSSNRNNWLKDNYQKLIDVEFMHPAADDDVNNFYLLNRIFNKYARLRSFGIKNYRTLNAYNKEMRNIDENEKLVSLNNKISFLFDQSHLANVERDRFANLYNKAKEKGIQVDMDRYKSDYRKANDRYNALNDERSRLIDYADEIERVMKQNVIDKYTPFFNSFNKQHVFTTEQSAVSPFFVKFAKRFYPNTPIDLYNHYIFLGKPNEKAMDIIKFVPIKNDVSERYTRQHVGTNTKGLSQKEF